MEVGGGGEVGGGREDGGRKGGRGGGGGEGGDCIRMNQGTVSMGRVLLCYSRIVRPEHDAPMPSESASSSARGSAQQLPPASKSNSPVLLPAEREIDTSLDSYSDRADEEGRGAGANDFDRRGRMDPANLADDEDARRPKKTGEDDPDDPRAADEQDASPEADTFDVFSVLELNPFLLNDRLCEMEEKAWSLLELAEQHAAAARAATERARGLERETQVKWGRRNGGMRSRGDLWQMNRVPQTV